MAGASFYLFNKLKKMSSNLSISKSHVTYVLLGQNPTFYFSGYFDREGNECCIEEGKDKDGNVRKKKFEFKGRKLMVPKSKTAIISFIDKAPFTEGSPNQKGRVLIKKLDPSGSAKKRVESKKDSVLAQAKALELKGDKLKKIALICGCMNEDKEIQLDHCMTYASQNPDLFMTLIDEKNMQMVNARALFKGCIMRGIIKHAGKSYMWEGHPMGKSEEEVIARISNDEELFSNLQEIYNNLLAGVS
jgi:hypothetical protein